MSDDLEDKCRQLSCRSLVALGDVGWTHRRPFELSPDQYPLQDPNLALKSARSRLGRRSAIEARGAYTKSEETFTIHQGRRSLYAMKRWSDLLRPLVERVT